MTRHSRLKASRKLKLAIAEFMETGELTPYLQKKLKGNTALLFRLYPGLAPTPDPVLWQFINHGTINFSAAYQQFHQQISQYAWSTKTP